LYATQQLYYLISIICMNEFLIDTHTHLYLIDENDCATVVQNAIAAGVQYMLFPHVDLESTKAMHALADMYPYNCLMMMGLHPTSVKPETLEAEISYVEKKLSERKYLAIGEIGMDLYWDKTHAELQKEVFRRQCRMAISMNLPVVVHSRESVNELIEILCEPEFETLSGVFHSFAGSLEQAQQITSMGFYLGISGVLTYKNSNLSQILPHIPLQHILLETDAPYLPPVPYRGKRNESAYIVHTAQKMAEVYQTGLEHIASTTTQNAENLFKITQYVQQ